MTFSAKFAIVLLCAATCAFSLFPREHQRERQPRRDAVTPAQLRDKQPTRWLLV